MPKHPKKAVAGRKKPAKPKPSAPTERSPSAELRRPFRSKLNAYADDIRRWQRQGKTYREMSALFLEVHGLKVHSDTINSFVLVRARRRTPAQLPEPATPESSPARAEVQPGLAKIPKASPKPDRRGKTDEIGPYEPANPSEL